MESTRLYQPLITRAEAESIDRDIARALPCQVCGATPCGYESIRNARNEPYSYRAFAVCPNGHRVEF